MGNNMPFRTRNANKHLLCQKMFFLKIYFICLEGKITHGKRESGKDRETEFPSTGHSRTAVTAGPGPS